MVQLVHLGIEETPVGLTEAEYKSRIRTVGIHLLHHQPGGTLALVLVGTLGLRLVLPLLLAAQAFGIAGTDVRHDAVDGFADAVLPRSRRCHQHVHQRGLVLHIVDVAEGDLPQMGRQCREDGTRHSIPVDFGHLGQKQLDEWRQLGGQSGRLVGL